MNTPKPGSDAALDQGCTCPVLDNAHGNENFGRLHGFWVNADCPIHGTRGMIEPKEARMAGPSDANPSTKGETK